QWALSSSWRRREGSITGAPSAATSRAMTKPRPREPPKMSTDLPWKSIARDARSKRLNANPHAPATVVQAMSCLLFIATTLFCVGYTAVFLPNSEQEVGHRSLQPLSGLTTSPSWEEKVFRSLP